MLHWGEINDGQQSAWRKTLEVFDDAEQRARSLSLFPEDRLIWQGRGRKRALIAVNHSLLVIFFHRLKEDTMYADLGGNFFDCLEPQRLTRYYVKRLEALGHKVTLESSAT